MRSWYEREFHYTMTGRKATPAEAVIIDICMAILVLTPVAVMVSAWMGWM